MRDRSLSRLQWSKKNTPHYQGNIWKKLKLQRHMAGILPSECNSWRAQMLKSPFYLPSKIVIRMLWVIRFHPSHRLFSRLRNHSTVSLVLISSNLVNRVPRYRHKQRSGWDSPFNIHTAFSINWTSAWKFYFQNIPRVFLDYFHTMELDKTMEIGFSNLFLRVIIPKYCHTMGEVVFFQCKS